MRDLLAGLIGFTVFMIGMAAWLTHNGYEVSGDLLLGMLAVGVLFAAPVGVEIGGKS